MATKLMRNPNIVWEELGREALLIDASKNLAWLLNESAARIWKSCERCSIEHIASARSVTNSKPETRNPKPAVADVRAFVEALCKNGWLQLTAIGEPTRSEEWRAMSDELFSLATCHSSLSAHHFQAAPAFRVKSLGSGPRRRPSPRGNSGPG